MDAQKPVEQPSSRLLGKARDTAPAPEAALSRENLVGRIVIQRDSGKEFNVVAVRTPDMGTDRRPVANLEAADGKSGMLTLRVDDLLDKVNTAGGPWRAKE